MSAILSKSLYTINKDRDKLCYLWTYDWSGPVLVPIYATEVDTHQIIGDMIAVEATLTPSLYILTQHRLYSGSRRRLLGWILSRTHWEFQSLYESHADICSTIRNLPYGRELENGLTKQHWIL
mgnify:CR=1 FL=1